MKKIFVAVSLTAAAMLSGCATVEKTVTCTETTHELLQQESAYLVKRKAEIEAYENGKEFGGIVYSSLSHADLVNEYKRAYNRRYDTFKFHADNYNRLCAGK